MEICNRILCVSCVVCRWRKPAFEHETPRFKRSRLKKKVIMSWEKKIVLIQSPTVISYVCGGVVAFAYQCMREFFFSIFHLLIFVVRHNLHEYVLVCAQLFHYIIYLHVALWIYTFFRKWNEKKNTRFKYIMAQSCSICSMSAKFANWCDFNLIAFYLLFFSCSFRS